MLNYKDRVIDVSKYGLNDYGKLSELLALLIEMQKIEENNLAEISRNVGEGTELDKIDYIICELVLLDENISIISNKLYLLELNVVKRFKGKTNFIYNISHN